MKKTAIITLYFPKKETVNNTLTVSKQVDTVILCDNSSNNNEELFKDITNVVYYPFYENLGLPGAFNHVLKSYPFEDDDYIFFFDQDSSIEENHIDTLIREYDDLEKKGYKVGCLGPEFFNTSNNTIERPTLKTDLTETCYSTKSIITSSMLCKYSSLKDIGFWNEKIFLDMADWDLCWRFLEKGYLCCMTSKTILHHSVGTGEKKIGPISLRKGAAFREYYQTRDSLYLLKEKYVPLKFKLRFIANVTVRPLVHLRLYEDKKKRLHYIASGYKDYFKNKHGALVD